VLKVILRQLTNAAGMSLFGWVMAQVDLAGSGCLRAMSRDRIATVVVNEFC
jgi:acyl-CoA hydrolase